MENGCGGNALASFAALQTAHLRRESLSYRAWALWSPTLNHTRSWRAINMGRRIADDDDDDGYVPRFRLAFATIFDSPQRSSRLYPLGRKIRRSSSDEWLRPVNSAHLARNAVANFIFARCKKPSDEKICMRDKLSNFNDKFIYQVIHF